MSRSTFMTLANGKHIDLLNPTSDDIDFVALAEHLGKEKRFNGATPDVEYSVAQHSYLGADAILAAGGTETEAGYFLLHDLKEALIKDDTTPKKNAIAELAAREFGVLHEEILSAFEMLEDRIDGAIHQAAGLPWPMSDDVRKFVKLYDLIMFVTEWRDLMHDIPHPNFAPYSGVKPLRKKIDPLPWAQARAGWMVRAKRLLPSFRLAHAGAPS